MNNKIFTIERIFKANIKDVWSAITKKELMKQWYFDLPEFKAEVGFIFEVTGGEEGGHNICTVVKLQKLIWKKD